MRQNLGMDALRVVEEALPSHSVDGAEAARNREYIDQFHLYIIKENRVGDTYNVTGQAAGVGRDAKGEVHQMIQRSDPPEVDYGALADELDELLTLESNKSISADERQALSAIAEARDAAAEIGAGTSSDEEQVSVALSHMNYNALETVRDEH
jgi:hypothetical protein